MPNLIAGRRVVLAYAAPPAVEYDPDATAWFAAVVANGGSDVDAATKQIISDFYAGLKTDSLYTLMDRIGLCAAHDTVGARLDLKDKTSLLTPAGSPVFTAFRGYMGDGVGAYLNTNWNSVSPAGNFAQNSSGITAYINATTSDVGDSKAIVGRITSTLSFIRPRTSASNLIQGRMSGPTTKDFGNVTSRLGLRSMSRTAAAINRAYGADGLKSGTDDTSTSNALANENFLLLRLQSTYATDRCAFWAAHAGFDATQTLNFRNRIVTMLTALGAN